MAKRSSFGPLALVMAATSCTFYVACGDDDLIIHDAPVGGSNGSGAGGEAGGGGTAGAGGSEGGSGGGGGSSEVIDAGPDAADGGELAPDTGVSTSDG